MKKHIEKLDLTRIKLIRFIGFLMGFAQAILAYVMSSFFKEASGIENVGIFYTVSYVIFLLILLNLHKLIRTLGKSNVFYFALLTKIIAVVFLIMNGPSQIGAFLLMLYIILGHIEWVALDNIVEGFSTDKMSGRIRGLQLTALSFGFLLGPFVSTYILERTDFSGVFLLSLILNAVILVFSLLVFRNVSQKFREKEKVTEVIKKAFARKNIIRIYYVSFVLDFFYAFMVIYTPIHLRNLGYSWEDIGLIFTMMLVPFVLVQYPMGVLADKRTGEKEFIIAALLIMGASTLAIFFMGTGTILAWGAVLFCTRIGAALIEILRDSYFYKRIDKHDVDLVDFFRTSLPAAYIFATILSSFMFLFLPIQSAFILVGIVVLSALVPAFRLNDNKCEAELPARAATART